MRLLSSGPRRILGLVLVSLTLPGWGSSGPATTGNFPCPGQTATEGANVDSIEILHPKT